MKKTGLFLFITLIYIQFGYSPAQAGGMVEVRFHDTDAENLPAVVETAPLHTMGDELYEDDDPRYFENTEDTLKQQTEEEIKLAHGSCRRYHGGHDGCSGHYHHHTHPHSHNYNPPIIIGPIVPVVPLEWSAICRQGVFYCATNIRPVGEPCNCHDLFGNIWFVGWISKW